jgi:hypothetical protein
MTRVLPRSSQASGGGNVPAIKYGELGAHEIQPFFHIQKPRNFSFREPQSYSKEAVQQLAFLCHGKSSVKGFSEH